MITGPTRQSTLTDRQLAMLASMLDEQWHFRVEQLDHLTTATGSNGRAVTAADREVSDAIMQGARSALADIEAARARMTDGTFGFCVSCGAQLPVERLEVLPQVASCVACQR